MIFDEISSPYLLPNFFCSLVTMQWCGCIWAPQGSLVWTLSWSKFSLLQFKDNTLIAASSEDGLGSLPKHIQSTLYSIWNLNCKHEYGLYMAMYST